MYYSNKVGRNSTFATTNLTIEKNYNKLYYKTSNNKKL